MRLIGELRERDSWLITREGALTQRREKVGCRDRTGDLLSYLADLYPTATGPVEGAAG